MSLTAEQIELFRTQGVLTGLPVDDEQQAARYRAEFDRLEQRVGQSAAQNKLFDRHFEEAFIWQIATHPKVLDYVESICGPDILALSTHVFCKYGPSDQFVAWHQDLTYWGLEPPAEVTAWYAIEASDRENGCMRVIPGRPGDTIREHGKSDQHGNLLSINQAVTVTEEMESTAVDCVLQAGEISLHDGTVIHGSEPNRSNRRRCGVTVRYVPTSVRPVARGPLGTDWSWRPVLVRGEDRFGHFELQPPPQFPRSSESTAPELS